MRMRMLPAGWMAVLATIGALVGHAQASAAPDGAAIASPARTIEWPAVPAAPAAGAAAPGGAVVAQSQITAGPLQGPLNAGEAGRPGARCPIPVHRVAHHRRVARRAPPVVVTALPLVPFNPAYAYPPPFLYRPVVPVYAFRPFYRPYFYRPYFYRPYFYRPHFYRGFY